MASISEPINVEQLMGGGCTFEINVENMKNEESDDEGVAEALLEFSKVDLLQDDDNYNEGEPFDNLSKKMKDLVSGGSIKKRIIREGYGELPPNSALVRVDYNAYIEYEPQPFDSTYARKRKHEFVLNNGQVIVGLDIAVQSMKIDEKSQFLIAPQYAYGALGCLGRVPKNATILFEIELHEIINEGAIFNYQKLSEEKQRDFKEVFQYCVALHLRAKDKFKKKLYHQAIRDYNEAIYKLDNAQLGDFEDQEKQQNLLLKSYKNNLVCYTIKEEPKKGCLAANKIYEMVKGSNLKLEAKVYFNNAKCLRMLGDYALAKKRLEIALKLEPNNSAIIDELLVLEKAMNEKKKMEKGMGQVLVGRNDDFKLK